MRPSPVVDLPTIAALPTPPPAAAGPTECRPLAVVRAYLAGRHETVLIGPDASLEAPGLPGQVRGRTAIIGFWEAFGGAIADRELTVEAAFEAADRAVVVLRVRGVHRGRLLGQAPTGRRLDLTLVVLARVDDGQIRHLRICFDRQALLEQLGAA